MILTIIFLVLHLLQEESSQQLQSLALHAISNLLSLNPAEIKQKFLLKKIVQTHLASKNVFLLTEGTQNYGIL
jgi:hypothetical protein